MDKQKKYPVQRPRGGIIISLEKSLGMPKWSKEDSESPEVPNRKKLGLSDGKI